MSRTIILIIVILAFLVACFCYKQLIRSTLTHRQSALEPFNQEPSFGVIFYKYSINLGDAIQTIAAIQQLERNNKKVNWYVERSTGDIAKDGTDLDAPRAQSNKIITLYNGWFDESSQLWPPPSNIKPIFISFHIYDEHGKNYVSLADSRYNDFYRKNSPVYTRDKHTAAKLSAIGAKFLGCLTLTLQAKNKISPADRKGIYLVDLYPDSYSKIPQKILEQSKEITHISYTEGIEERNNEAQSLLNIYAGAKLIITSRLHCILPCLAFDTPCILMFDDWSKDPRFSGLTDLMSIYGRDNIDWFNHKNKDRTNLQIMINNINTAARELL